MQFKKFNVAKPVKFIGRDGEPVTKWEHVGTMTVFIKKDGKTSRLLEIPAIGLEAQIFPFEAKIKENAIAPVAVAEVSDVASDEAKANAAFAAIE